MEKSKFKCIKGLADNGNLNVIIMRGDLVELVSTDEGEVLVEGIAGWCKGFELTFPPYQFVTHFKSIN